MRHKIKTIFSTPSLIGKEVWVKGWIRTVRHQKSFSFVEINDGSSLMSLQAIVESSYPHYSDFVEKATTGASVFVKGIVAASPGAKQTVELKVSDFHIVGHCETESYPLQKKQHSFEFLRSIAHLRPRTNTFGAVMRVRSALSFAIHRFFYERGFVYLHSPIITLSDCEGAGTMFQVTTLDVKKPPRDERGDVDYSQDFFGKPAFLTVSGQLNGEIYASALSDIYTFGPTFRAENSNTSRHLAEFWMIEPEMAFAGIEENMRLAEDFLKFIFNELLTRCPEEMNFFDRFIKPGVKARLENMVKNEFARVTYGEAIDILKASKKAFEFPVEWGTDLQSEHERYLAEEHFKKPVIVRDYPEKIKAFYMRKNEDGQTVAAMDILAPEVGEIIGGSVREERYEELLKKMDAMGLKRENYDWYLELRRFGSVPHAGFGAGFERLLLFATGMENIRDVIPFPRTPGHAEF